jgi:hypothetical protein
MGTEIKNVADCRRQAAGPRSDVNGALNLDGMPRCHFDETRRKVAYNMHPANSAAPPAIA